MSEQAATMGPEREGAALAGQQSYRSYAVTWAWLLLFTVLGVVAKLVEMPRGLLVFSVLSLMSLKAFLIFANFMHLREEMRNLLIIALTPLMMAIILFYGVGYDF